MGVMARRKGVTARRVAAALLVMIAAALPRAAQAAPGIDRPTADALLQMFAEIVVADGLRFRSAPARLSDAAFSATAAPERLEEGGVRVELAHDSGSGWITVIDSAAKPAIIMTLELDHEDIARPAVELAFAKAWAEEEADPPVFEGPSALAMATARIDGREITLNVIERFGEDGAHHVSLMAVSFLSAADANGGAGPLATAPEFDRLPGRRVGASPGEVAALIQRFATLLAAGEPNFDRAKAQLVEEGWRSSDPAWFFHPSGYAEFEFRTGAENVRPTLRIDVAEETAIVSLLTSALEGAGARDLTGPGLAEWGERILVQIGGRQAVVLILPAEEPRDRSVAIAAFLFLGDPQ